jgi:hypothetical protein
MDHLFQGLRTNLLAALRTTGLATAGKKEPKMVIDLRDRAHS